MLGHNCDLVTHAALSRVVLVVVAVLPEALGRPRVEVEEELAAAAREPLYQLLRLAEGRFISNC